MYVTPRLQQRMKVGAEVALPVANQHGVNESARVLPNKCGRCIAGIQEEAKIVVFTS